MFLSFLSDYLPSEYLFTLTDQRGASVATADFIRSAVQFGSQEETRLFVGGLQPSSDKTNRKLARHFPGKQVRAFDVGLMPKFYSPDNCVYSEAAQIMPHRISQLHTGKVSPILSLMHALDLQNLLQSYLNALLFGRSCDALIVSSSAGEKAVRTALDHAAAACNYAELRAGPAQIEVVRIPLGSSTDIDLGVSKASARKIFSLPPEAYIVLYVGRFNPMQKAELETLIHACSLLKLEKREVHLVLAGHEEMPGYIEWLKQVAGLLQFEEHLSVIPNFPGWAKDLIYRAADVYVAPADSIQETFGLAILEAMRHSLPVIASDWSGHRDVVTHEETGFLVPTLVANQTWENVDAIEPLQLVISRRMRLGQRTVIDVPLLRQYLELLARDPELSERMGRAGRARLEREFSWPVVIRQHEELWSELSTRAAHTSSQPSAPLASTFGSLFGEFPSTTSMSYRDILCTAAPSVPQGYLAHRLANRPDLLLEAHRILSICSQQTPLSTVFANCNPTADDLVWWLAKRDLLHMTPLQPA